MVSFKGMGNDPEFDKKVDDIFEEYKAPANTLTHAIGEAIANHHELPTAVMAAVVSDVFYRVLVAHAAISEMDADQVRQFMDVMKSRVLDTFIAKGDELGAQLRTGARKVEIRW